MSALEPTHTAMLDALKALISSGIASQSDISRATGVHQSQISRILSGNVRRLSKNVQKLCTYAGSVTTARIPPDIETRLSSALEKLTANGPEEAMALENLVAGLVRWRNSWRSPS